MVSDGRQEFAAAVSSTIESIQHLYREVDRLIVQLRAELLEDPTPLNFLAGIFSKGGRDASRMTIRNEYGAIFIPIVDEVEDADEDDEEPEDDENEDAEDDNLPRKRRSRTVPISSDISALAIRIAMYEPQRKGQFEPEVQYAVMYEWALAGAAF